MARSGNPLRRSTAIAALVCVLLVALADWLFYRHVIGWTIGLFGAALLLALLTRRPRALSTWPGRVAVAGVVGLLVACVEEPGLLAVFLLAVGLASVGVAGRGGRWRTAGECHRRVFSFLLAIWARVFRDSALYHRWRRRGRTPDHGGPATLRRWLVPIVLTLIFLALFYAANPVVERWIDTCWIAFRDGVVDLIEYTGLLRILLWCVVGVGAWGLLRARSRGRTGTRVRAAPAAPPREERFFSTAVIVRCLVLFNLLFAVHTGLDAVYLWGGAALPDGMTYAHYARRGAYPLVATALLSGLFVLVAFRRGSAGERDAPARGLVYAWIAQNVLLLVSAAWRLALYVDAYSLTRLRVAAGIWMLLVAIGLLTIVWRLARRRSNDWLLGANTLAALTILSACAFVNFDGLIARFNARHCREITGTGVPIDLEYLDRLGPESLPALDWLAEHVDDESVASLARARATRARLELDEKLEDWRGWTWRRARLSEPQRSR